MDLPCVEMVVVVCLLAGGLLEGALLVRSMLGGAFVSEQVLALWDGVAVTCGCFSFSDGADVVGPATIARAFLVWMGSGSLLILAVRPRSKQEHAGHSKTGRLHTYEKAIC